MTRGTVGVCLESRTLRARRGSPSSVPRLKAFQYRPVAEKAPERTDWDRCIIIDERDVGVQKGRHRLDRVALQERLMHAVERKSAVKTPDGAEEYVRRHERLGASCKLQGKEVLAGWNCDPLKLRLLLT